MPRWHCDGKAKTRAINLCGIRGMGGCGLEQTNREAYGAELKEKQKKLRSYLFGLKSAAVAFSAGIDSTFLMHSAREVLGDKAVAVTARSCIFPKDEQKEAEDFCKAYGIKHFIFDSGELSLEEFSQNPPNRCYICKSRMLKMIKHIADTNGISNVVEGSNIDDESDYRPGMAAINELGIKSPLRIAEMTKNDVRALSKIAGLAAWNKPSFACLASRFPYGERITKDKLFAVERAERLLRGLGFCGARVRIHGTAARIEINAAEFGKITETQTRLKVAEELHAYGFSYVSLDLDGYRQGSMNEVLNLETGSK